MKLTYKHFSLFVFLLALSINTAHAKREYSKTIEKTFSVQAKDKLSIDNRYGNVTINTISANSVKFRIEITVKICNSVSESDALEMVEIEFGQAGGMLSAETEIENSGSSWWQKMRGCNPEFEIHYFVDMPKTNALLLENKYGNVTVGDLDNRANIQLKYGNAQLQDIGGALVFELGYGQAVMGDCKSLTAEIAYSQFTAENVAGKVVIESKYSQIAIEQMAELNSESKYDKYRLGKVGSLTNEGKYDHFTIEKADHINFETRYSHIKLKELNKSAKLEMGYGSTLVEHVMKDFERIEIESSYTSHKLGIPNATPFTLSFEGRYSSVKHDGGIDESRTDDDSGDNETFLRRGTNGGHIEASLSYGGLRIF